MVLTQSPERHWQRIGVSHPDHMAAGEAALRAVYPDARNPFAHPELLEEGYEAFSAPEVWVMGREHPNHFVDVTDVFELKRNALLCHASQLPNVDNLEPMLRMWLSRQAEAGGLPEGRLAEGFYGWRRPDRLSLTGPAPRVRGQPPGRPRSGSRRARKPT